MASKHEHKNEQKREQYKAECCSGDEILCISAPSPITLGLLGRNVKFELPCLKLSSDMNLTGRQTSQLLDVFIALLQLLGRIVTTPNHMEANCSEEY